LLDWVWPGGVVFLAALAATVGWAESEWLTEAVFTYVWVLLGAGALLAWRFRRSRVVACLALLFMLALVPPLEAISDGPGPWEALGAFGVIAVAAATVGKDRGVLSPMGVIQILAVLFGGWVSMATAEYAPETWGWLDAFSLGGLGPDVAAVLVPLTILALGLGAFQAWRREHPVERGLVWTALVVFLAVAAHPGSTEALTWVFAGGLILTLSVVETSHGLAYRDELTGLPTRRALWGTFDDIGSDYTVAMLDVDHFKKFNDTHGHDVGDQVLKMVASRLQKVSGGGRAFRFGGEEFTIVFPGRSRDEAFPHLEDLRQAIEDSRFAVRSMGRPKKKPERGKKKGGRTKSLSVTVSIGVAERSEKQPDPEAVIKAADRALYRAKKGGRNRVAR